MDFTNIDNLNNTDVAYNSDGNRSLTDGYKTIATQQDGLYPNSTQTIVNHQVTAETTEVLFGETKIMQHGQVTGFMKEGLYGETNLYDQNHQFLGSMNAEGNISEIITLEDPLSKATMSNFQELKFSKA